MTIDDDKCIEFDGAYCSNISFVPIIITQLFVETTKSVDGDGGGLEDMKRQLLVDLCVNMCTWFGWPLRKSIAIGMLTTHYIVSGIAAVWGLLCRSQQTGHIANITPLQHLDYTNYMFWIFISISV